MACLKLEFKKTITDQANPSRFKLDSSFNDFKIQDGFLHVKSRTPLICYLNYEGGADKEGWFNTGDMVALEEGYLRVTGRDSDLINLAGRKFFPSDVEELIMQMESVKDVTIKREDNDLIGSILIAEIIIDPSIEDKAFRMSFKEFCQNRLPYYMHPQKVVIVKNSELNPRHKKIRTP